MPEQQLTVLIVDDTEENRYAVSRYLTRAGFQVLEARTAEEGLRKLTHNPDVVLLDVRLPDMVGFEVCRIIKSDPRTSKIPVLHTSATYTRSGDKIHGLEGGADGYLVAPFEPEELLATIRSLIRVKKAEAAAQTAALQWEATFDAISDCICLVNSHGAITRHNAAFKESFGTPATNESFETFAARADLDVRALRSMHESRRRESAFFTRRGKYFRLTADPLLDSDNAVQGAVLIVSDLTHQTQAERALKVAQNRLDLAVKSSGLGLWHAELPFAALIWNEECKAHFGLPPEAEVDIEVFYQKLHPDDREPVRKALANAIENHQPFDYDYRVMQPDGSIRWIRAIGATTSGPGGDRIDGITMDITERKRFIDELQESKERYRTLLDALPQLVWTALPDGRFDFVSRQWSTYTRKSAHTQLGWGWLESLHPDDRSIVRTALNDAAQRAEEFSIEVRIANAEGQHGWFTLRAVPLLGRDQQIAKWFGTCTDINTIVSARETMATAASELERLVAERTIQLEGSVQELESFCYTIAHDLRAPLRAMQGFSQALLEDYASTLDSQGREFATRVSAAAVRMDLLITDLLEYSRLSRMDVSPVDVPLDEVVQKALHLHSDYIESRSADVIVQKPLGKVRAHRVVMEQVLGNLIGNALKFVDKQTRPRILVRQEELDATLRLWVEDNGIGIEPEHHSRIFQIFERLHATPSFPGTGVGLAIVKKGVERMGGSVGVSSEPGKGSKFWVELPKA
ncbi:MAG TPA: PAS domain-containing protein [Methylomirabilota bacterium]|nr:PAS domain-containing protein [Methylomirabilota bacterium]